MSDASLVAALLWSKLQVLTKGRFEAVLQVFGGLEEAAAHLDGELLRNLGCREETVQRVLQDLERIDPAQEGALLRAMGASLVTLADPGYPASLKHIPDAPPFLYARGDLDILQQPCVALVGTRRSSAYGKRVTNLFVPALVRAGMVTVSGLARGIDTLVANATLEAGGKTAAVLGQGIATLGSREDIAEKIVAHGGLILSEFPLAAGPDLFTFPLRNRIIAGLSLGTIVLEAPEKSGALITAKLAQEYCREVFAVPGQIFDDNYAGCHELIATQRAILVRTPEDVLRELGVIVPERGEAEPAYLPASPEEEVLLRVLSMLPQRIDDLMQKSGLSTHAVSATLTMLELSGAAKNLGGGEWVRSSYARGSAASYSE